VAIVESPSITGFMGLEYDSIIYWQAGGGARIFNKMSLPPMLVGG